MQQDGLQEVSLQLMEATHCNSMEVVRFLNTPVASNTYVVIDDKTHECIIIDPGSKNPCDIVNYLNEHSLKLQYILLTHEHFDHCWGVKQLLDIYPAQVVATKKCAEWLKIPRNYFNKLYFNSDETYCIDKIDIIVDEVDWILQWGMHKLQFYEANGHTDKGMCILLDNLFFTGDTILYKTKPYIKKRYGGDINNLQCTIKRLFSVIPQNVLACPGHGSPFQLSEAKEYYNNYFKKINK